MEQNVLSLLTVIDKRLIAFLSGLGNNLAMAAIVLLSSMAPSRLATELEIFGHRVWEALDVSEVLFLCEQHRIDAVIIAHDVEDGNVIEKQLRGMVMRLQQSADAAYVDTELSSLFPGRPLSIQ